MEDEPRFHDFLKHRVKDKAYRCFWCKHEDFVGTDFISHINSRHGYDIKNEKFLEYFTTKNVYPFVKLLYCEKCLLRTSDNPYIQDHRSKLCRGPQLFKGKTTLICDANLAKFLAAHHRELKWVKSDMMPKRLPNTPAKDWQGGDDRVEKAGDDESLRSESTEAYEIISPSTGPSAAPTRAASEDGDDESGQAVAMVANQAMSPPAQQQQQGMLNQPQRAIRGAGRGVIAIAQQVTTSSRISVMQTGASSNPYESLALAPKRRTKPGEIISDMCSRTGHDVEAIGDLLPTSRRTKLTVQRLLFEEVPQPGIYQICYGGNTYARMTVSGFPQNIHYRRYELQENDPSDPYLAYVWMTKSIPAIMSAWVSFNAALDDGCYDVIERVPNATASLLTVSSEAIFQD